MHAELSSIIASALRDFLRSDHANFWAKNISSIFLTDSTEFRGLMKQCYHRWCDTKNQFSPKGYQLVSNLSYSLAYSLEDRAEKYDGGIVSK